MIHIQKSKRLTNRLVVAGTALLLIAGVATPIMRASLAHAVSETLSSVADKTVAKSHWVNITDLQITNTGNEEVSIAVHAPSGSFEFGTQAATITGSGTKSVVLTGSPESVNQSLASMRYRNTTAGSYTITADLGNNVGNVIFNDGEGGNGHAYIIVPTLMSWQDAKNAAETYTFGGKTGYLATITDATESQFVYDHLHDTGWIGANDIDVEGVWRWQTGPEAGTQFWSGNGSGSSVGGNYSNWATNEPNNADTGEDCAQFWTGGKWNDLNCSTPRPFVVEFGDAGQPISPIQTTFSVEVTPPVPTTPPMITATTPANGATNVDVDAPLVMVFDKLTYGSEGNLKLHNVTEGTSQDILNQEGWSDLDFSGNIVTVNWNNSLKLQPCSVYYMEIPNTIFWYSQDSNINNAAYYAGMSSPLSWRFTTECEHPVVDDSNIMTFANSVIGASTTVELGNNCVVNDASALASGTTKDAGYEYKSGLVAFEAECSGGSTVAKVYQFGVDANDVVLRKHNPATGAYFTVAGATITNQIIDGKQAAVATYTIVDNGDLDLDKRDGYISDPVGLGSLVVNSPNTGIKRTN